MFGVGAFGLPWRDCPKRFADRRSLLGSKGELPWKAAIQRDIVVPFDPSTLESDHRIGNSLSLTAALLRMQRERSNDDAVRCALHSAEARIASIANFHRHLHGHASHERIDLGQYLCGILREIETGIGVRCIFSIDPGMSLEVSARVARSLKIAVNELALNALKHAYNSSRAAA